MLSTINGIFSFFAVFDTSEISIISSLGFPIVSAYITLVFSFTAFAKLLGSSGSTNVVVIPYLGNVTFNKFQVPPYKLFEETIWSPVFNNVNNVVANAAEPEEVATPAIPPSNDASLCSSMSAVGLFNLV